MAGSFFDFDPDSFDDDDVVNDDVVNGVEDMGEVTADDDDEVIAAEAALQDCTHTLSEATESISQVEESMSAVDAKRKELLAQLAKINRELVTVTDTRQGIIQSSRAARQAVATATKGVESATRRIAVARQSAERRIKTAGTVEKMGRIASTMPWFTGITTPEGKTLKCLPHQWEGMKFLASAERAILGDAMGLGKTLTALGALDLVGSKRALVICPNEITSNFLHEIRRWAPHRTVVSIAGKTKAQRGILLEMARSFEPIVVICNYEAWRKDLSLIERLIDMGFDTLIADEAHAIKGTSTDAFSGVRDISLADNVCPYCKEPLAAKTDNGTRCCVADNFFAGQSVASDLPAQERLMLTRSIKNLWLMTGTPILNAPEDLYPMLYLLDSTAFPYKYAYLRDYCVLDSVKNRYEFHAGGLESLVKRLGGRYIARTLKTSGVVLPPQDVQYHTVEFEEGMYIDQQRIIRQLTKHAQIVLAENNKMNAIGVLALITRLRQANVWPGGIKVWDYPVDAFGLPDRTRPKQCIFDASEIKESLKLDKVVELVGEFEGKRVAVFSQFKTALAELEERLVSAGVRVVRFDGDTPESVRARIKTNFDKSNNEVPEWDVVLCNYKTGGVGLNLTAATHTIILDEEWNPGKRDQAYARTHRMGQDEATSVHVIRLAETIDTWLADLISGKEDLIGGFEEATSDIQQELLATLKGRG